MSQIQQTQLWKQGTKGNIEFLSNWKRLENEDPQTYKIIEQREGFSCQDHEFEYHVGMNKYGLWLSRRRMGVEGLQQIESNDKPPQRPPMSSQITSNVTDPTLIQVITQLTDATKLVALALVSSNPEEKESIRQRCLM